jgi:hypothetical protein
LACYALYIHAHHDFKQNDEEQGAIQLPGEDFDSEIYTDDDDNNDNDDDDNDDDDKATIVVASTAVNEKLPFEDNSEYPF